ncbi:MAG: carboxypeptidase-like regulatory domain-containing protein [bacterium]
MGTAAVVTGKNAVRGRWRMSAFVALGLLTFTVQAQTSSHAVVHSVRVVVFDSVAGAPLSGAVVQARQVDSANQLLSLSQAQVYWSITDAEGRFAITGVPTGRFAIGFQHSAVIALGLELPLRAIDLATDTSVVVDLGISAAMALSQNCARRSGDSGLLTGYALDALNGAPIPGAVVDVRWTEITGEPGKYRATERHVEATTTGDGRYVACDVPGGEIVRARITHNGYRELAIDMATGGAGASRHDVRLAGAHANRGTAALAGRVMYADSTPVQESRIALPALGLQAETVNGAFAMSALPPGSWMVEAQAIGHDPQRIMVDLDAETTTSATITMSKRAQVLDALNVTARPIGDQKALLEIIDLKRKGFGTFFLPGNEVLGAADLIADVVKVVPGFAITGSGTIEARVTGGLSLRRCSPTVFVNGDRSPLGMLGIRMADVLAVAAYPDVIGIPVQWKDARTCAVIAVWTKQ